jgi:hypothetical protein
MTIVPVEIELGVSEAIAVSVMMIHGRIETHHINKTNNTQIKNKSYAVDDIALEFILFLHIGYIVHADILKTSSILRRDSRMLAT